jgi:hypothetical protein
VRRVLLTVMFAVCFVVGHPAPAHAWWHWLDEYSGPGPFMGIDVQWRLACIQDPAVRAVALQNLETKRRQALEDAQAAVLRNLPRFVPPPGPPGREDSAARLGEVEKALKEALAKLDSFRQPDAVTAAAVLDEMKTIRNSPTPGEDSKSLSPPPSILRSRNSFDGKSHFWASFFGAGCVSQPDTNPVGSLNLRMAYLWSLHNNLTYAEPEFKKDGPQVRLFQPELSFTVFVDQRKSVELGSAMGVSTAFVDKPGVSPFSRFYWRPLLLTVSPVSLLRLNTPKGWRALILTSSIVIMPQELNATDFGAVPGTFHTGRDMQGFFGFALDFSRF